jgi:N-acylglucosamine-6-phosphate 2-epimerase
VKTLTPQLSRLRGGLIASCQPVRGGPLDQPELVLALARAVEIGGAVGLRLEGLADLKAVRPHTQLPIIGLVKREVVGTEIYITPELEDIHALVRAGADIIAFDATLRSRPLEVEAMLGAIHATGKLAMADVSTLEEGLYAFECGADLVGTTLSGYTPYSQQQEGPDLKLVFALSSRGVPTVAEGRINSPEEARKALECGAFAVTIGSALTRLEHLTARYVRALELPTLELSALEVQEVNHAG